MIVKACVCFCVCIPFEMGQLFPDLQVNVTLDADFPDSFMELLRV